LILINDGQDLVNMPYTEILEDLFINGDMTPIFSVGIHCAADRKKE
jgi:hypothetical protein